MIHMLETSTMFWLLTSEAWFIQSQSSMRADSGWSNDHITPAVRINRNHMGWMPYVTSIHAALPLCRGMEPQHPPSPPGSYLQMLPKSWEPGPYHTEEVPLPLPWCRAPDCFTQSCRLTPLGFVCLEWAVCRIQIDVSDYYNLILYYVLCIILYFVLWFLCC